jgi:hypothetical protein
MKMSDWRYNFYQQQFGSQITEERFLKIVNSVDYSDQATIDQAWFDMYSEGMGGKLDKETYLEVRQTFEDMTAEAFCGGDGSRSKAMTAFTQWLRKNHPGEHPEIIFRSVDAVTAYS